MARPIRSSRFMVSSASEMQLVFRAVREHAGPRSAVRPVKVVLTVYVRAARPGSACNAPLSGRHAPVAIHLAMHAAETGIAGVHSGGLALQQLASMVEAERSVTVDRVHHRGGQGPHLS